MNSSNDNFHGVDYNDRKVGAGSGELMMMKNFLSIYDQDMNRINTNKPLAGLENDNKHEKSNVKEQSIKR